MQRRLVKTFSILLLAPLFFFLMLNAHELGHTVLARLAGDANATYYLYKEFDVDKACYGCNIYDPRKLSNQGNLLVTLGGILATALVLLLLVGVRRMSSRVRAHPHLFTIAVIIVGSDVPFQVFRGVQADVAGQTGLSGIDLADFLFILHSQFAIPIGMAKIVLILFAAAYCFMCYRLATSTVTAGDPD